MNICFRSPVSPIGAAVTHQITDLEMFPKTTADLLVASVVCQNIPDMQNILGLISWSLTSNHTLSNHVFCKYISVS